MTRIQSYALGEWFTAGGAGTLLYDAVTGEQIADASSEGLDFAAMASYARETGGRALRRLTFHQRARLLKALALYLTERKEEFYRVSAFTAWMVARKLLLPYVGLPNVLAGRFVVPELLQTQATPANLAQAALNLFDDTVTRRRLEALFAGFALELRADTGMLAGEAVAQELAMAGAC